MSLPAEKARRQREILEVLEDESIGSQDDLARALRRRGHLVTQATLSRDLRDLRVGRVPVEDGYRYAPAGSIETAGVVAEGGSRRLRHAFALRGVHDGAATRRLQQMTAIEVTGIDANEIGVVVRTLTGRAQGVAVWLDGLKDPEILGTIAGDDTILVLPRTIKKTGRLRANLARVLGLG